MENERQKIHRIASAMISERNGENLLTQLSIIGTLLTSATGSFVKQHPDVREGFIKTLKIFTDDVFEKCGQIADKVATKSNHHAS